MKRNDKTTRIAYIIEAGFEYFISLFVTSTMLGYILDTLGFSDALQGIISTVATFTCGAQLFALVLSGKHKKRIATIGHLINQACFVLLYLLPIFDLPSGVKTMVLIALLVSGHLINNAVTPTKITWLMSAVPNETRGSFTAIKEMVSLSGGIGVSILFGAVADQFRNTDGTPTTPYYVICTTALLIMMIIHTATLILSTEKPAPAEERRPKIGQTLASMVHNRSLVKVIGVGMMWNIASALSISFFASYLREELAFSFTLIAWITTASSICRIVVSPLLGRIADRHSFATSMTVSFSMVAVGFLAVVFTTPETRWLYLVYACLHAFAMAGINSGVINLIYDYVPDRDRAVAMGIKNAMGGILAFFTALGSGLILARIQANGGLQIFGMTLYAQQFLAFLSCAMTLILIIYMRTVIAPMKKINEEPRVENDEKIKAAQGENQSCAK